MTSTDNFRRYEQYAVYETDNSKLTANSNMCVSLSNCFAKRDIPRKITYKCKYCNFKNTMKKTVITHMIGHSVNKKRFWCGVCGQTSNWKHVILRHCHHVHGTSGPILLKDSSPASPPNSEDVRKATSKNSIDDDFEEEVNAGQGAIHGADDSCSTEEGNGNEKIHKCSICPYECHKVFDLRIHSYLHRPREGAIFKCMFCPFYVSLKRSWLNHMRLHVDRPQEYAKKFMESGWMPESNTSDGSKSVQIGFKDNFSSIISSHEDSAEGPEGVPRVWVSRSGVFLKMFKCRHCPHVSKKRAVIMTHEKMHRKRKIAAGKPTYKCSHCNYTSKNAGVLTAHQKVHLGKESVHSYVCSTEPYTMKTDKRKGTQVLGESTQSMLYSPSRLSATSTIEDGKLKLKIIKVEEEKNIAVQSCLNPVSTKSQKVYHSCGQCPAKFNKLHQMLSHRSFHGADLPWHCSSCSYAARHRPHLHKHERVHTPEYLKTFMRPLKRYKDIQQHQSSSNLESQVAVVKNDCSVTILPQKSGGERKHQCQMCPATFLKYSTLIYHMHLHNNNGKFKCPQCTYSVSNIGNLARHIKVHTGSSMEPDVSPCTALKRVAPFNRRPPISRQKVRFACTKCPAVFDKQVRFGVHTTLHGSMHRFRCDKCDYAVKFAAILSRHKALHENKLEESISGKCNVIPVMSGTSLCSPRYIQARVSFPNQESMVMSNVSPSYLNLTLVERQQLLLHNLQSKPIKNDSDSVNELKKLYCCDRCPYVNQRKDAVQSHLKRHIPVGKGTTMCPHCDYGTSIHSFLREHVKLHFKPSRNRLPEAFLKLDNFQICVRSKTVESVVFMHPLHDKEFEDNYITKTENTINDDEDNESTCSSVKNVVRELVRQVESQHAKDAYFRAIQMQDFDSVLNSDMAHGSQLLSSVSIKKQVEITEGMLPMDNFKGMVGVSVPNADKDTRDFMEFAMCLGFST